MPEEQEKPDCTNTNFFYCIIPITDNFRASVKQYSVGKNMAVAHLLKRSHVMKSM